MKVNEVVNSDFGIGNSNLEKRKKLCDLGVSAVNYGLPQSLLR